MHLLYVDESGDPGTHAHSSKHYILSGLIVNQDNWDKYLIDLKSFRKDLRAKYGLNQRVEVHASELIRIAKIEDYKQIRKTERINLLKDYCRKIPRIFNDTFLLTVSLNRDDFPNGGIFEEAWINLLKQFDSFLNSRVSDTGIVICDDTESLKLNSLVRMMRNSNEQHIEINNIIEDTFSKSSHHSYFIQTADVIAHLLYRKEYPKGSLKKFGLEKEFDHLTPILLSETEVEIDLNKKPRFNNRGF